MNNKYIFTEILILLYFSLCSSIFYAISIYTARVITSFDLPRFQANPGKKQTCQAKKFVFQKVHKTGSTFIESILRNYAKTENFQISSKSMRYGGYKGGYPGRFNSSFYPKDNQSLESFFGHMVWNWPEIRKLLTGNGDGFVRISIVRDPMDTFKSAYNYFYLRHFSNLDWLLSERNGDPRKFWRHSTCAGEPGLCLFGGKISSKVDNTSGPVTLSQLVSKIKYSTKLKDCPFSFRHNNSQFYEQGHSRDFERQLSIKTVRKSFDFIVVLERLKESLAVLRFLLCMEWNEVIPFYISSLEKPTNFMKKEESIFYELDKDLTVFVQNELINLDTELYEVANSILDEELSKMGGRDEVFKEFDEAMRFFEIVESRKSITRHQRDLKSKSTYFLKNSIYDDLRKYMEDNNGVCNKM